MILTCPSCGTQYYADDATIGESGRTVKCAACDHSWHVDPEGLDRPRGGPAIGAHHAYRDQVRARRRRLSRTAAGASWLATGAAFFALGAAAVLFRNDIAVYWPQSATAYQRVGLEVNRFGLDFVSRNFSRTFDGTTPILRVSGEVENVTRTPRAATGVRIGLLDETGREVDYFTAPITPDVLTPGARGMFEAILESPPLEAFELEFAFVGADGASSSNPSAARVDAAPGVAEPDAISAVEEDLSGAEAPPAEDG